MFEKETVTWASERLHIRAAEIINNRPHTVTGYSPFEVLRNRRNVNFMRPRAVPLAAADSQDAAEHMTAEEIQRMHTDVQQRTAAQADRMIKRSSGNFEPYNVGDVVYVLAFRSAKGRKTLHRWMEPAGEIVEFHEPASYHVRWITHGPHKADAPGSISTRAYHHG